MIGPILWNPAVTYKASPVILPYFAALVIASISIASLNCSATMKLTAALRHKSISRLQPTMLLFVTWDAMLHLLCERHEEVGYARHCLSGLVSLAHESLHTAWVLLRLVIGPGVDALDDAGLGLLPDQSGEQGQVFRLHHLHWGLRHRPGGEGCGLPEGYSLQLPKHHYKQQTFGPGWRWRGRG